jgi:cyanophycin synthetase
MQGYWKSRTQKGAQILHTQILPKQQMQGRNWRRRTEEEINSLIIDGINEAGRDVSYEIIPKEIEALKHAMGMAEDGTFITALSDVISNAIDLVQEYRTRELMEDDKNS